MKAMLRAVAGRLYAYAYPTEGARITVTVNPSTEGRPNDSTWGWISVHEPSDVNGGLTVYLTRKQAYEVRDALGEALLGKWANR